MGGGCRVEPVSWRWLWVSDCGVLVVLMLEINFLASSFHASLNWGEGWNLVAAVWPCRGGVDARN